MYCNGYNIYGSNSDCFMANAGNFQTCILEE